MKYIIIAVALLLASCKSNSSTIKEDANTVVTNKTVEVQSTKTEEATTDGGTKPEKQLPFELVIKTDAEWKAELDKEAYYVLREEGTERPFTSDLLKEKREGVFICGGCNLDLFKSDTKFKSGTGWPSFYEPINEVNINEDTDHKLGYARTEVECGRCGGHLGHVFNDGPEPTGLRYCINGAALDFRTTK